MLKLAYGHKEDLNERYLNSLLNDRYIYANCDSWMQYELKIEEDSWNKHQFVSIDKNNNVIGYFGATVDRDTYSISGLFCMNFENTNMRYAIDFKNFIEGLFYINKFNKISFNVVVGNPAEEMYDKFIDKYNGRIVGTRYKHVKLKDGNFYDVKMYEIFKDDFVNSRIKE